MKKNKILIVAPSNKGTIAMCSLNLWKAFQLDENVIVKCILIYKVVGGIAEFDSCDVCSSKKQNFIQKCFNIYHQVANLKAIKREFRPNITISTLYNCSVINILSGGDDVKVGVFHSPHNQEKARGKLHYLITLMQYKFIYPKLHYFSCVSKEVKDSIEFSFPHISKDKLKVIYNVHLSDNIIKQSLCPIDEENLISQKYILYCGRMDRNKAPERLLKAYLQSSIIKQYSLVYMGADIDNLWTEMTLLIEQANAQDKVHYIGTKSNPYPYIKNANVLASCSYSEALPGVIIESLILGTPIISTNSSEGVWEILSCDRQFDKDLNSKFITANGIITTNHSDLNVDIKEFKEALEYVLSREFHNEFAFASKVLPNSVVKKYLNLIIS